MKYICPECKKPYTPTRLLHHFPRHGRTWVNRPRGQESGWEYCEGSERPVTQFTEKWVPKKPGSR